jgi:hypothetical protein
MPRACQEFVFGERNGEERKKKVIKFIVNRVGFTNIVLAISSLENKFLCTSEACKYKTFYSSNLRIFVIS